MENRYKLMMLIIISLLVTTNIAFPKEHFDENDIKSKLPQIASNSNAGKDFWFSIPPAYTSTINNFIKIYCISQSEKNVITLELPNKGVFEKKVGKLNEVINFDLPPSYAQAFEHQKGYPCPKAKIYNESGIHIFSDSPIIVYVMVSSENSSEGFLAIPSTSLGKEYIISPYTSSYENGSPAWAVITSIYDNTKVTFNMGGDGMSSVETESKGFLIVGKFVNLTLQKGDVYVIGTSQPMMDMTGSKIVSNKPIAVTTGNFCTFIPTSTVGCNYNVEMETPTQTWGQSLLVPFCHNRSKPGIIRIFAKYPHTQVFREGKYLITIPHGGGPIADGWFEERATSLSDPRSPYPAIYTADKPISITYYNPSAIDDKISISTAPFQMQVTPTDQFQSDIIIGGVNTLTNKMVKSNFLNIVYELNEFGFMPDDLEFGIWNNNNWQFQKLVNLNGADIMFNPSLSMDGKRYGHKNITLPDSSIFRIRSASGYKFTCYSYGFGDKNFSYGFPSNNALNYLESKDTTPPEVKYEMCSDGSIGVLNVATVTDLPNDENIRSNLSQAYMIKDSSFNYTFWIDEIISGETITANWRLIPIDSFKEAKAVLVFKDMAGNDTTIRINHYPATTQQIKSVYYGNFKPGDNPFTKNIVIKNIGKKDINCATIKLKKKDQGFTFDLNGQTLPSLFKIGDSILVRATFTPDATLLNSGNGTFEDSLGTGDCCLFGYKTRLFAGSGDPLIQVNDSHFGSIYLNDTNYQERVIQIVNSSSIGYLSIYGFKNPSLKEFKSNLDSLLPNLSYSNPLIIDPKDKFEFKVYFKPSKEMKYSDTISITSDARLSDSLCILEGDGVPNISLVENGTDIFKLNISPNPISSEGSKISYTIASDTKLEINILDTKGQLVNPLFNNFAKVGNYELEIPYKQLSSGVYFIEIKADNIIQTKQFVIEK